MGRRLTSQDVLSELEFTIADVLADRNSADTRAAVRDALVMLLAAMSITPEAGATERVEDSIILLRNLVHDATREHQSDAHRKKADISQLN